MEIPDCLKNLACSGHVGDNICNSQRIIKGGEPVDFDTAKNAVTSEAIMKVCCACPVYPYIFSDDSYFLRVNKDNLSFHDLNDEKIMD